MEKVFTKSIRNIVLLGHSGGGKTSLAESMLYISRLTDRLGNTADGNTVCDFDPEEIKRGYSISSATAPMLWNGAKINILDTPGFFDFEAEVRQCVRAADSLRTSFHAEERDQKLACFRFVYFFCATYLDRPDLAAEIPGNACAVPGDTDTEDSVDRLSGRDQYRWQIGTSAVQIHVF